MVHPVLYNLCSIVSVLMMTYVVLWSLLQTFNANPLQRFMWVWAQLILYYAAFTMPWWALMALATAIGGMLAWWLALLLCLCALAYFYCGVVLPSQLQCQEQSIDLGLERPMRVAVLANLKVGIYSGKSRHIQKWVSTLNRLEVDAVVITGDWLYHPGADLVGQLMLFKSLNKPVYTVMSRTDLVYQSLNLSMQGKPLLEDTLSTAFAALDIIDISQICLQTPTAVLCGWQDDEAIALTATRDAAPDSFSRYQDQYSEKSKTATSTLSIDSEARNAKSLQQQIVHADKPVIILAAHYNRVYELPKTQPRPLVIAGDGRSEITGSHVSVKPLASRHPLYLSHQGLHQHELAQVYVAHGVGMSRWPFRVTKPTIDILTIR
ncbi:hypothetical protein [Psychrobacter pygoscelis]|uniref:hypothetical protein n=1 Tax=Psychrobacter pygoscelis TaxID=2488563 RepID=UPI001038E625|nr:hypothetical protein [Psychrobacter pygoscelis]